ncbi:MAG: FlgD immunoglobulin-like domain containing protein, partial [bacterium]
DLASDCNGHIWCATNGGGLLEIKPDLSYATYTNASTSGQLPSDNLELVKINAGALWVATFENGVVRMPEILTTTTGLKPQDDTNIPAEFNLYSNYPNPFNPTTTIRFDLTRQSDIELKVFDLKGRLVKSLKSGRLSAGTYQVTWDGTDMYSKPVASGIYIYRLDVGQEFFSCKMLFIK